MGAGDERMARLAAALRANLRRRKETAMPAGGRTDPAGADPDAAEPAAAPAADTAGAPRRVAPAGLPGPDAAAPGR
jgi:hypothetical protein